MAKKLLALVLALVMVMGLVACGGGGDTKATGGNSNANSGDMITLTWWYPGVGGQVDIQKVNDAFNELLHTYDGFEKINIKFHQVAGSEYNTALTLGISAKEPMDIINTSYYTSYTDLVNDKSLVELTDLLEGYPALKNEFPQWLWDYMVVKGGIYAVPNYQRASNQMFFYTPKDYMDNYGDYDKMYDVISDQESDVTEIMGVMEEYLKSIRLGEGDTKYMKPFRAEGNYTYDANWRDVLTGNFVLDYDSDKVEYMLTNDAYKASYEIAARWYDEGIYTPDEITAESNGGCLEGSSMLDPVGYIAHCNNGIGDEDDAAATQTVASGYENTAIALAENYFVGMTWQAGGQGISVNCEHPQEALKFLQLMNTEEGADLYNMVVYGIEGEHYEFVESGVIRTYDYNTAQAFDGARYGTYKWAMGNTFYAYDNQGCTDGEKEISKLINENPDNVVSRLIGMTVDTTGIATELAQVTAVENEYYMMLLVGAMGQDGWEASFNDYVRKLEAAGIQKILDNLQKQVDAHLAKQG